MKVKCIFILVLVAVFVCVFGCKKAEKPGKPEWQGRIEYEDGVKIVKNPEEPLFGEIVYDLEEDLSIGREDDENYLFYRASNLALDSMDSIYVLENGNCRIQKFDKYGNYLSTIGKKGQGPGEFESPWRIRLNKESGNIYVMDRRKIKIFDKDGNYIKAILLRNYPFDLLKGTEGSFWGKFMIRTESGQTMSFDKVNTEGEVIKNIATFPYGMTMKQSGKTSIAISHSYIHDLSVAKIDDRTFIYGYSDEFELNIVNENGELLFKIHKEEPYHSISEKEKDEIRGEFEEVPEAIKKDIQFPDHRPFFDSIFSDEKGRIYIHRMKSAVDKSEGELYDIFSKQGHYLYRASFLHWPKVMEKGYFYTIFSSEEAGEELVKRFRIKNWESIKEGTL